MPTDDLTCQQLVELLTDYLESALPPELSAALEAHLARCPGCRAYLAQVRATIGSLGALAAPSIPPDTLADLLAIFRAWQVEAHRRGAEDAETPEA
ncbi:MAG TPA: zf-HC2 domain-containing protein [Roseiflexaceae bacterium]|nr:zf-HC2 domain-containing protein [Roseiflexaceae bacterium]